MIGRTSTVEEGPAEDKKTTSSNYIDNKYNYKYVILIKISKILHIMHLKTV